MWSIAKYGIFCVCVFIFGMMKLRHYCEIREREKNVLIMAQLLIIELLHLFFFLSIIL